MATPEVLTTTQAQEYLNLSRRVLMDLIANGKLPASKIGGSWRIRREACDALLAPTNQPPAELLYTSEVEPRRRQRADWKSTDIYKDAYKASVRGDE